MKKIFTIILSAMVFISLDAQNVIVSSTSTQLYSSETSDCNGGPNNYKRGRVRISTGSYSYPEFVCNDCGGGWNNNTSASGSTTVPYNAVIQITAWGYEEDGGFCGGDDGVCGIDWNSNASYTVTNSAPCTTISMEHLRNCGITWGARANFSWQYDGSTLNDSHAGTIAISGTISACNGYNPATITNASSPSAGYGTYQWQANSGSGWSDVASTSSTYNPPALSVTTSYRRRYRITCTDAGTVTLYSNTVTFAITPDPVAPALNVATPANGSGVCPGAILSATFNAGSDGLSCTDEYRFSVNGGTTWSAYTSGTNITAGVFGSSTIIQTRRDCSGSNCDGSGEIFTDKVTWNVTNTESTAPTGASSSVGASFSCASAPVDLTVAGGSLGSGATWEWYSDAGFATSVGSGSPLTVNPTSTTTYYVRAEGDCNNTTGQSTTVNVNGSSTSPSSSVVLASGTSSSTCLVNDAVWHHYYNATGELLASVNSNGQNLGDVTVTITVGDNGPFGQGFLPGVCGYAGASTGEHVMPRYWDISVVNQPSAAVDVIFYYKNSDVASLVTTLNGLNSFYEACWGDVNVEADLMMTVAHTGGTSELFTGLAFADGPNVGAGQRQIAFQLSEFSGGKLHSSGGVGAGNALPVEMVSFTAKTLENNAVALNWVTATEINNSGFDVERSTDGVRFEKIAFVEGNGNSNEANSYETTDNNVSVGNYYYRLKQIDFDGIFEYSKVVNASIKGEAGVVVSYFMPNPSNDFTILSFEAAEGTRVEIEVLDNLGRTVSLREKVLEGGKESISFNLNEFATGVYTARIKMNNEEFTRKLVVRK